MLPRYFIRVGAAVQPGIAVPPLPPLRRTQPQGPVQEGPKRGPGTTRSLA